MKKLSVLSLLILLTMSLATFAGETTAGDHVTVGQPIANVEMAHGIVLPIDALDTPAVFAANRTSAETATVTTAFLITSANYSAVIVTQQSERTARTITDHGRWATMPTRIDHSRTSQRHRYGRSRDRPR